MEDLINKVEEQKKHIADSRVSELSEETVIRYLKEELDENDDTITKLGAIGVHFDLTLSELENCTEGRNSMWHIEGNDYLVATDDEADAAWIEALENYLEEAVLREIPGYLQMYFDGERWMKDARYDGRGHGLASYDGNEEYSDFNETTIYFYRR